MPKRQAPDPNDPRTRTENHRERGCGIILRATWADIASLLGLSISRAKVLGSGAKRRFDPHSLTDLMRYASERAAKKAARRREAK